MEYIKFLLDNENYTDETVEKIFEMYFRGSKNIITPNAVRFTSLMTRSRIAMFEITTNEKETLYGITSLCYDRTTKEIQRIDLNKLVDTYGDAIKYINGITLHTIDTGDLYGRKI